MKEFKIIVDGPNGCFDVEAQDGRVCNGLSWDEMIAQIIFLTIPKERVGNGFAMKTPGEWYAHALRKARVVDASINSLNGDKS